VRHFIVHMRRAGHVVARPLNCGVGPQQFKSPLMAKTLVFVGAVVRRGDEILLVRQAPGHSLEGQWTIPWGRVEEGESPVAAAVRETQEESGIHAKVDGLLGVQELPKPQDGSIALVYLCSHLSGTPAPRDRETDAARYYSFEALETLREPMEPWSDWLVRRVFAGTFHVTYPDTTSPLQPSGAFL
jgi:ADP-ribose pyrophosphatase YjhB (NUDIX family)